MVAGITVAKYGFFSIVLTSAGFFIANIAVPKHVRPSDDLVYRPSRPLSYESLSILDKDYMKCLTEPSKSFCLLSVNKRMELFKSKNYPDPPSLEQVKSRLRNITASRRKDITHPLHRLVDDFSKLMKSLGVGIMLIEPSMLFCVLSPSKKLFLMTKGYHPGRLEGSRNVVTFGVFENEAQVFDEKEIESKVLSKGFEIFRSKKSTNGWQWEEDESARNVSTVRYQFVRRQLIAHVVVFHRRGDFLWHSGMSEEKIGGESLLFQKQGSYENFTTVPLDTGETSIDINIPADPLYFLLQIETSKFLECKSPGQSPTRDESATKHPIFTNDQLKIRAVITIGELKSKLFPEATPFWLWSETLIGWHQRCDVFRYSTDIHLAVALKTLQGFNLTQSLVGNEYIKIKEEQSSDSVYRLDCHGLLVNLYIVYDNGSEMWYEEQSIDKAVQAKLVYPKFTLCSTDVFGYKVNVPCSPEEIFETEYGSNWTNNDFFESGNYRINRRNLFSKNDK